MPLRCLASGREIFAFQLDSKEFEILRAENARSTHLTMVCCGSRVVLRTSKMGTRHFAHSRKGDCITAPETSEHLLAKLQIALVIEKCGWTARTEERGQLSSGEWWIADVLATKAGEHPIAFEVQWSRQLPDRTAERTATYERAGIRVVWLMRQSDIPCSAAAPVVRLILDESRSFNAVFPSPYYNSEYASAVDPVTEPNWRQRMSLDCFIEGTLAERLYFGAPKGNYAHLLVHGAPIDCWRCHKSTRIVLAVEIKHSLVASGAADQRLTIYDFDNSAINRDLLVSILRPEWLRPYGIGAIKPRSSKMAGTTYLSNGCVHCDVIQGRFFEHEVAYQEAPIMSIAIGDAISDIHTAEVARDIVCDMRTFQELSTSVQTSRWWLKDALPSSQVAQSATEKLFLQPVTAPGVKAPINRLSESGNASGSQGDLFEHGNEPPR